jgi:hypothetical protein
VVLKPVESDQRGRVAKKENDFRSNQGISPMFVADNFRNISATFILPQKNEGFDQLVFLELTDESSQKVDSLQNLMVKPAEVEPEGFDFVKSVLEYGHDGTAPREETMETDTNTANPDDFSLLTHICYAAFGGHTEEEEEIVEQSSETLRQKAGLVRQRLSQVSHEQSKLGLPPPKLEIIAGDKNKENYQPNRTLGTFKGTTKDLLASDNATSPATIYGSKPTNAGQPFGNNVARASNYAGGMQTDPKANAQMSYYMNMARQMSALQTAIYSNPTVAKQVSI